MTMDGVDSEIHRLKNRDVDLHRRLRASRLFELLQESSIAHTEALGMGRAMTLDRGLLWMVTRQRCDVARMPLYDETVAVETWPGDTLHVFFPRYYRMTTDAGEELMRGSALWMLVDVNTRRFVFPERYGVEIRGVATGLEAPEPAAPASLPTDRERTFTVPYSYVDLNGHMNNTRFFDLADDCIGAAAAGRELRSVRAEYKAETRLGEELLLRWGGDGSRYYLAGEAGKTAFSMALEYRDGD